MTGFRVVVVSLGLALSTGCPAEDQSGAETTAATIAATSGPPTSGDDGTDVATGPTNPTDPTDPTDPTTPSDSSGGVPGADCCAAHAGSGCDDPAIESCVCEDDAVCCTFDWDALCVNAARNRCHACGGGGGDESGTAGDETTGTTSGAGEETSTSTTDPTGAGGDCCEATPTPGCPSSPTLEMCVCDLDDYCCTDAWDNICVGQAVDDCAASCDFGEGCCEVHPSPGCDNAPVEACVCAIDSFCCEREWDGVCVDEVTSEDCGNC